MNPPVEFVWPVRVYYEDTDAGGVVYHASYLRFLERSRTEWLRSLGFEQDRLAVEEGVLFAVRRLEIDYLVPARFNERLAVTASIARLGRASLEFDQRIRRRDDGTELCRARVSVVCVGSGDFRPRAIPQAIRRELDDVP
ncbi:MAG: tol-pal system-associated acyl-CoA thioesterase [Gammaproteobacteria bacterium]|nr:MAG: tol-pal system-associated acyl-CoA thioesterase [Gammaproteobacteria bacterium]